MNKHNSEEYQKHQKQLALEYHAQGRPGKIEVVPTKPCNTSSDLAMAYSPGVAQPCLEIAKDGELAFKYTAKGNLVAVISNGTAVLGLGNIGPLASKPVMEGKGNLFKRFADIDVFDIEIKEDSVEGMVRTIKALEPTFGGINLEDIKAPECFEVEEQLIAAMDIPVFHDDQHGTAIIASAAFLNALEVTQRKIQETKVVFSGAGASAIACAQLFLKMGVKRENLILCDSKGAIYKGRKDGMNKYKEIFAIETECRTLTDALKDADAFVGCSARGLVTQDMIKNMAPTPIIFALANPDPEIYPHEVFEVRPDAIMATGRSDFPNQVNNVLGFPFIFRGALDVRARKINDEMKLAAVKALSDLAKEEVPDYVKRAYGNEEFSFGKNYLIPKPFDTRVLTRLAPAVALAAQQSGVARVFIKDMDKYAESLEERLGSSFSFMRNLRNRINQKKRPRIVFAEGSHARILKAISVLMDEKRIEPILLGHKSVIHQEMNNLHLEHLKSLEIVDPISDSRYKHFFESYYQQRQRQGVSLSYAMELMAQGNYFGSMLVKLGHADGMITGATQTYPECIRPIMRVLGNKSNKVAGIIILVFENRILFLADCTVQVDPSAEDLANIALNAAKLFRELMMREPRVAFLSYSNFGSNSHPDVQKMCIAAELAKKAHPGLMADGEMQADVAVSDHLLQKLFNFSTLDKSADILIFPNLNSSNIAYKLLYQLANARALGPVLVPLDYSVNIVQRTTSVEEIINMSNLTAVLSQAKFKEQQ